MVSTKWTAHHLAMVKAGAWPEPDLQSVGLTRDVLEREGTWVSWPVYLALLEALAAAGEVDHEAFGAAYMRYTGATPFRHLLRLLGGLERLYRSIYTWILPANIAVLRGSVERLAPGHLRVRLELEEGYSSTEFFRFVAGAMREIPPIAGRPPARVTMTGDDRSATYDVLLSGGSRRTHLRSKLGQLLDLPGARFASMRLQADMDEAVRLLRESHDRLSVSERRWEALVSSLPIAVRVLGPGGEVEAEYGAAVGELPIASRFSGDAPVDEVIRVPSGGVERWWSLRTAPLPGPQHRSVLVGLDVTDQLRAEEALRKVEERYVAAQKMEAIGRMAGGVAHNFNNLLAAIGAQSELLGDRRPDDPEVAQAVTRILRAVDRGGELSRGLLAFGRQQLPTRNEVDLNDAVREAVELLRPVLDERIGLEVDLAPGSLGVPVETTQLQQMVMNLVFNARDAMAAEGTVTIRSRQLADRACLEVRDEGHGMSDHVRKRAFEPFFTTKPAGQGNGLGLSTAYWVAKQAGGTLELQSATGEGTTVRILLPLVQLSSRPPVEDCRPLAKGTETVLVVEDESDVRELLVQLLEAQDYRVLSCADGLEALALVERPTAIDLLVTDVIMPRLTGDELARRLRAARPELPVLFVSGYAERADALSELGAGVAFLAKPFTMRSLAHTARALLDGVAP